MSDQQITTPLGRRELVARLTAVALSWVGLSAFRRLAPMDGMPSVARSAPIWDDKFELVVDLELVTQSGARTHRPYVAIWVEDAAGRSIRTLSLWVSTVGRGPRYIR
jgi:Predicted periplasmic protein (DUF2271)